MASTGQGQTIKLWNVATGTNVATLKLNDDDTEGYCVFRPDGKTVASVSSEGTVKLWDAATGKNTGTLKGRESDDVLSIAFSPSGETLATGSIGTIKLWDLATGMSTFTLQHPGWVVCVAFQPGRQDIGLGGRVWR